MLPPEVGRCSEFGVDGLEFRDGVGGIMLGRLAAVSAVVDGREHVGGGTTWPVAILVCCGLLYLLYQADAYLWYAA